MLWRCCCCGLLFIYAGPAQRLLPGLPEGQRLLLLVQCLPDTRLSPPHRPPPSGALPPRRYRRNIHRVSGCARPVPSLPRSIIRYFTEGPPQFAKSWDNRINLLILLLLAVSITSDIVAPDVTHHDGGIVASLFLFARYLLQSVRLCRLLSESRKALEVSSHQTISLGELGEEESGESSH